MCRRTSFLWNGIAGNFFPLIFFLLALSAKYACAGEIDLTGSAIVNLSQGDELSGRSVTMLQEEVYRRSGVRLPLLSSAPGTGQWVIHAGRECDMGSLPPHLKSLLQNLPATGAEGYKLLVSHAMKAVVIAGNDSRGVLYGTGRLLRTMEMIPGTLRLTDETALSSTPRYPVRGHQLGYRPKTNAYDAWSVEQYESYIRDLAVFGANSIEIMPPRTDDDFTSVHMKIPAIRMIVEQSRICREYGMDVWMWYPNMGTDYSSADSVKKELEEREEIFRLLPRLDALFVPGGDPGHLEPDELFGWLEKVAVVLRKYHPRAKIWVSPQVFKPSEAWYETFYHHINQEYPWLGGVVYGPWIRTPLPEVKKLIHPSVPVRLYPDITHSLSCQYPVPDWDIAYAMTLGRECINPRPVDQKHIHNLYAPLAIGSISYSEGTNDDVNKFIWSGQDWDPETPVMQTLREYGRYFIGPEYTETIAHGLIALEENLRGPLPANERVQVTLQQWQDMERNAPGEVLANPRFQNGLIRAYYDAYIQRRLVYETHLESQARNILEMAPASGSEEAILKAEHILTAGTREPVAQHLKERCHALADSLFRTFGAQLTIDKHHAAAGRGNFMDNIDIPLNDAPFLLDQLSIIRKLPSEKEKLGAIHALLNRNNPGPGGFYDNFGNPATWKRVKAQKSWAEDPGSLESPRVSFGVGLAGVEWVHEVKAMGFEGEVTPLAWMNQVNTLYDTPLKAEYTDLDPSAGYLLRIAYTGRFRSSMKLDADGIPVHGYIRMGTRPLFEFSLPHEVTADGKVTFTWMSGTGDSGGGERGSQVAEIWLIRKQDNP